jgi:hypothetical protein
LNSWKGYFKGKRFRWIRKMINSFFCFI